jgi:hypothetical protein
VGFARPVLQVLVVKELKKTKQNKMKQKKTNERK